jgi:glycosyltransferase involved in cell wall biosynthesis
MSPPPRLLVVTAMYPTAERPAWGIVVAREVDELRSSGYAVTVVSKRPGAAGYLRQWMATRQAVRRERPQVVHAHFGTSGLVAAAQRKNFRLVVTFHGSDLTYGPGFTWSRHWLQYWMSVLAAARADAVVVQAEFMADRLPRRLRRRARVLPQAVDLDRFVAGRDTERADGLVLFLGDSRREVKRRWLADAAVQLLADDSVSVVGLDEMPPEEIPAAMRRASVGLLTSEREGLPVACREALASGLPVVAVDLPGTRELAAAMPDAVSLAAPTPDGIADQLRRALSRARADRGGERGVLVHQRARQLGWDRVQHAAALRAIHEGTG